MRSRIIDDFVRIEQAEFEKIDYQVMGIAYGIQNQLGRLLQEKIYPAELAERLNSRFERAQRHFHNCSQTSLIILPSIILP